MRGDSGLSDSQYLKCQKYMKSRNKDQIKEMEKLMETATLEKKFKNADKKIKVSFFQKIIGFFSK